jgi:hypothetical protein
MKTWVNQILGKELLQDALGQRRWKAWGQKSKNQLVKISGVFHLPTQHTKEKA